MSYFQVARCIELSTIDYLSTQIAASWTGITLVKTFTNAYKSSLPVVCVRLVDFPAERQEIGSTTLLYDYTISIDIFATSDGQRIDLANFIMEKLKDQWTYYDFVQASGSPETLTKTSNGRIHVRRFLVNNVIEFDGEGVDKYDLHRHLLLVNVRKY
jgi:hypothetical protein